MPPLLEPDLLSLKCHFNCYGDNTPDSNSNITKKGCIHLGFLNIFIDFFKWITFIKFDRFLKIFVKFCKVSKCINVFNKLLF